MLLAVAAFILRAWAIGDIVPNIDELFDIYGAFKPATLGEFFASIHENPAHVIVGPLLNFLVGRMTSSTALLRLTNVMIGAATIPVLFQLGRRLGGERLGLGSAALLAFSVPHIDWSRRAGFWPACVLLTILSALFIIDAARENRRKDWITWACVGAVFVLEHPYAWIVLIFEAAWIFRRFPEHRRRCVMGLGVAGAVYMPWHIWVGRIVLEKGFYASEGFSARQLMNSLGGAVLGLAQTRSLDSERPGQTLEIVAAVLYGLLFLIGGRRALSERAVEPAWELGAFWVPAGLSAVFLVCWRFTVPFATHYVLWLVPFYLLLVARGLEVVWDAVSARWPRLEPRWSSCAMLALLGLAQAVFLIDLRDLAERKATLFSSIRAAADRSVPDEVLVFFQPNQAAAFAYCLDRRAFLALDAPRRYRTWFQFRVPDDFKAAGKRFFVISDPARTLEQERPRWMAALKDRQGGTPYSLVKFKAFRVPDDEGKIRSFALLWTPGKSG